jgi:hypothetical protein
MHSGGVSRRGFLTGFGAAAGAAGAVALGPSDAVAQLVDPQTVERTRTDRFSRLFERLPSFAEPTAVVQAALVELGKPGGILDALDPLEEGPTRLITNPELSPFNTDNSAHTAGVTFFGQFLDHDMTFDTTSQLGVPTRPERSPNSRTPALDLDSVYGRGPMEDTQLYERDRTKLRVESGGLFEDLPRASDGTAIIADPRNDENMMIAGLQVAMLKFHNRIVDALRDGMRSDDRRNVFAEARRLATWHYQWIIVHEFLPAIVARDWSTTSCRVAGGSTGQLLVSRAFRSSFKAPRIASGTAWCGRRIARTWLATTEGRSLRSSSTRPAKARPIQSISAAARARLVGSLAGRRSLTSAGPRQSTCGRTRSSTPRSRRRCSIFHWRRSPAATCPRRCRSAICFVI